MSISKEEYVFRPFKVTEVLCRVSAPKPRPRSGHRIACDDANVYLFGGYNPALPVGDVTRDNTWSPVRPLFKELWSFNIATKTWRHHKVVENMPEELASNAMCMSGRYLMVCITDRRQHSFVAGALEIGCHAYYYNVSSSREPG